MNKARILDEVRIKISEKIKTLEHLIAQTRESNNETKSSMGDKYETGREMLQQEINTLQIQLNANRKAEQSLKFLNINPHLAAGSGSLVETEAGFFYISVSLGEIKYINTKIYVISLDSPLAKAMHGKKKGEGFALNGKNQTIKNIW